MRKPIQFIPGCMVNISYNVVVNTNTVNKQAHTYTRTHKHTYTHTPPSREENSFVMNTF